MTDGVKTDNSLTFAQTAATLVIIFVILVFWKQCEWSPPEDWFRTARLNTLLQLMLGILLRFARKWRVSVGQVLLPSATLVRILARC